MERGIAKGYRAADRTTDLIFPQHIHFRTHMQQWLHTSQVQFIQFFHKADHPLQVVFDPVFFGIGKLQAGEMSQFVH